MRIRFTALAAAWLCSISLAADPASAEGCVQVVAQAGDETAELELKTLSKIFYKKQRQWPDGTPAVPVDQKPGSSARQLFSRQVHGRSASAVESYWQRQIFSGRGVPPKELATDQDVLDFVRIPANGPQVRGQGSGLFVRFLLRALGQGPGGDPDRPDAPHRP